MTVQLHLFEALLASDFFLVDCEMVRTLTAKGVSVPEGSVVQCIVGRLAITV